MPRFMAPLVTAALAAAFFALCLASVDCGSGACQQSPCMPGVPLLSGTCKCVPVDGGPSLDGGAGVD